MGKIEVSNNLSIQGNKVLILGNWSYRNMGDELILLGTTRLLQEQGKEVIISAYDPKRLKAFFSQFEDLQPINFLHEFPKGVRSFSKYFLSKRKQELKIYKDVDSIIIGGGEILTEESKSSYWYRNLGLLPVLKQLDTIPVYLMGGIQIPKKKSNLKLFDWLLGKTNYIYARDGESVEALKEHGFNDVDFFMDTSRFAYPWENIKKTEEDSKTVLINLNKNGEKFFDDLLRECEQLLTSGYTIKYVPVSKGRNDVYNDLIFKEELEKRLLTKFEVLDWEENFAGFLQEVKNAEMIITSRLHLFLIASFLGAKTKVYPYQMKILKMKKIIQELGIIEHLV